MDKLEDLAKKKQGPFGGYFLCPLELKNAFLFSKFPVLNTSNHFQAGIRMRTLPTT